MARVKPTRNNVNRVKPEYAEVERTKVERTQPVTKPAQEETQPQAKKPGWWKRNHRKVFGIAGTIGGIVGAVVLGKKAKEDYDQRQAGIAAMKEQYPEETLLLTDEEGNTFSCVREAFYNGEDTKPTLSFWVNDAEDE